MHQIQELMTSLPLSPNSSYRLFFALPGSEYLPLQNIEQQVSLVFLEESNRLFEESTSPPEWPM
jgi:hypothetical protein